RRQEGYSRNIGDGHASVGIYRARDLQLALALDAPRLQGQADGPGDEGQAEENCNTVNHMRYTCGVVVVSEVATSNLPGMIAATIFSWISWSTEACWALPVISLPSAPR